MRRSCQCPARTVSRRDQPPTPHGGRGHAGGPLGGRGGLRVPTAWERARRRVDLEDPVVGWTASLGLTLLALFLRLWKLGTPKDFEFDETYYAKDAWSLLHFGYAQGYVDGRQRARSSTATTTGQWTDDPSMIVHPEVGKWLIALGEKAFGMDPFGWRVAAAVVGSLMVLVMCRLVRRMTGSTALGLVAGLLLSLDGLQFVLSRLALLDIFLAFFILLRGHVPGRRPRLVPRQARAPGPRAGERPRVVRPGAAAAVPALAAGQRRLLGAGDRHQVDGASTRSRRSASWSGCGAPARGARSGCAGRRCARSSPTALPAFVHLVVVGGGRLHRDAGPAGWCTPHEYEKALSSTQYTQFVKERPCTVTVDDDGQDRDSREQPRRQRQALADGERAGRAAGVGEVVQSLRSLCYYHRDVYTFHTHFLNCSTHTYASKPSGWLLLNRPVGVAADTDIEPGTRGCDAAGGQHLPQAGAADRHPDDLVGRHPRAAVRRGDVGRRRATGGSASPWSAPRRRGCRGCSTTTGRSSCSTPSRSCRSWCSR